MKLRDNVRDAIAMVYDHKTSVEQALLQVDECFSQALGKPDTMDGDMPQRWSPALKKQWVNFREHLRRQARNRWFGS